MIRSISLKVKILFIYIHIYIYICSANYGLYDGFSNRRDEVSMCHFMETRFELKNLICLHRGC